MFITYAEFKNRMKTIFLDLVFILHFDATNSDFIAVKYRTPRYLLACPDISLVHISNTLLYMKQKVEPGNENILIVALGTMVR